MPEDAQVKRKERHAISPAQGTERFTHPIPFGPEPVQRRPFGIGIACPFAARPPLIKGWSLPRHARSFLHQCARYARPPARCAGKVPALRPQSGWRDSPRHPATPETGSAHRHRRLLRGQSACSIRGRKAGCKSDASGNASRRRPQITSALRRVLANSSAAGDPTGSHAAITIDELHPLRRVLPASAAIPALRARAAVKGCDMSSATTSAPIWRARSGLSSVDPLST